MGGGAEITTERKTKTERAGWAKEQNGRMDRGQKVQKGRQAEIAERRKGGGNIRIIRGRGGGRATCTK